MRKAVAVGVGPVVFKPDSVAQWLEFELLQMEQSKDWHLATDESIADRQSGIIGAIPRDLDGVGRDENGDGKVLPEGHEEQTLDADKLGQRAERFEVFVSG